MSSQVLDNVLGRLLIGISRVLPLCCSTQSYRVTKIAFVQNISEVDFTVEGNEELRMYLVTATEWAALPL